MTVSSERVKRIKRRWEAERKVSTTDIEFLLERARAADTMAAADTLRSRSGTQPITDAFVKLFGGVR